MLAKHRATIGRSRLTPRADRRAPTACDSAAARMAAARRVACRFVAARWPKLAAVEPVVTARIARPISPELLQRLEIDQSEVVLRTSGGVEYTFTFAHEIELRDDAVGPLVAAVTVDDHQRIVKTTSSK